MLFYKHRRRKILFLIILFIIILLFSFFVYQLKLVFISLSKSKVHAIALQTINNIVNKKMSELNYTDLINFQKKDNEEITIVNTNIVIMNALSNEISNEIINELESIEYLHVSIPLGSVTGSALLSGSGPDIDIRFVPISEVRTEFTTDFYSTGINQTKHKIFLNVFCNIEALSTFMSNTVKLEVQIPVLETVIIGGVPSTYYQIDGANKDNMLQIID